MSGTLSELLFYLVVLLANVIQGITGFAGTLLSMPAALLLVGMLPAKTSLNALGFVSGLLVAAPNRRSIVWKELWRITLFMGTGMAVGFLLEGLLPAGPVLLVYAIFLILLALKNLLFPSTNSKNAALGPVILVAAGIIHALYVSGGSLLVVYAARVFREKAEFRATLSAVWVLLNGFMLVQRLVLGGFTPYITRLTLVALIPMGLGILLGGILQKRLQQKPFMLLTNILILISGVSLLFN